jgi:hypothetical protein
MGLGVDRHRAQQRQVGDDAVVHTAEATSVVSPPRLASGRS